MDAQPFFRFDTSSCDAVLYALKRHLRRRSTIEPEIGHLKADGLLGRNFLKGTQGDGINALLCGAGHNLRKILAQLRAL